MGAFDDALGTIDSASAPNPAVLNPRDPSIPAGTPRVVIGPDSSKTNDPFSTALDAIDNPKPITKSQKPSVGTGEAFVRGAAQGVTANFYDELKGISAAGGAEDGPTFSDGTKREGIDHVIMGLAKYWFGDKDAEQKYNDVVGRERQYTSAAEEQHPVASMAGNLAGGLASVPIGGEVAGASKLARAGYGAAVGAGYGAAFGAGEGDGLQDRATRAATGAVTGGALGAVAPSVIDGVSKGGSVISHGIGSALGHPIETLRGAINPDKLAASRVSGALRDDLETGRAGLSPAEIAAAKAEGQPIATVDLGGENTRALGRSAANTSAAGRAALDDMTSARFGDQSERVTNFVRGLSPIGGNASMTTESLNAAAKAANKPAYAKAYAEGQDIPFHDGFKQLMTSPDVQEAVKAATRTGANKAAANGFQPVKSPFTFPENGLPQLSGNAKPSLQFWDAVKQNLDDKIGAAQRAGEKGHAADLIGLKSQLVQHLDDAVPSYAAARSGAAQYFGAENALEAGQKFVTMRGSMSEARAAHSKMNPAQKTLFAEGYVSDLADKVSKVADNRNVTIDKIFNSKDGRERTELALGRENASKLETFLRIENISDQARKMLGNSTTARQIIEANLAGGVGKALTTSAVGGLAAGAQAYGAGEVDSKTVLTLAVAGGLAGGRAYINTKVAQRVGELLASHDPKDLITVVRMAGNNPQVGKAIRQAETALQKVAGQHAPRSLIGGPIPAAADNDQPQR